jgi:hypothetical protein
MEIIREDPPAQSRSGKYDDVADQLADDIGSWYRIATGATTGTLATNINKGAMRAFQPAGSFEAVSRTQEDGVSIWARYVGEGETAPNK